MTYYAKKTYVGTGSIRTIHNDLVNCILPALEEFDVEITIHNTDAGRDRSHLPGIWFAWASNLRNAAIDGRSSQRIIGYHHKLPTTTEIVGPQAWDPKPARDVPFCCDNTIATRNGVDYHHIPMAVNPEDLPKINHNKRGTLYFASSDAGKQAIMERLPELMPGIKIIYADYGTPRKELLEMVNSYEFVFSAGYCAVEALALGCRVILTGRRVFEGVNESNLRRIMNQGYTWDNRPDNLASDVKNISAAFINNCMDAAAPIEIKENFHLTTYLMNWRQVAHNAIFKHKEKAYG